MNLLDNSAGADLDGRGDRVVRNGYVGEAPIFFADDLHSSYRIADQTGRQRV